MHITLVTIGKSKLKEEQAWAAHYLKQLPWKFTLLELPESKAQTANQRKADEAARILTHAEKADVIIALDERGKQFTSREFAKQLEGYALSGKSRVCFIIGGADGLDDAIRNRAKLTLALGTLTLPHLMARLVLIEQLYRASTIIAGHPYHRD